MCLNVFSWGLLLNNGGKNTVVLNNRRHLLMISHKQRNTADFLRRIFCRVMNSLGGYSAGLSLLESCTRKLHKKSKKHARKRDPID